MPAMFIGGAERSLIGLLGAFDETRFDVSLFLNRHEGEFLPFIPQKVRILRPHPAYVALDMPIRSLLRNGHWHYGVARILAKLMLKGRSILAGKPASAFNSMYYIGKYLLHFLPKIEGEYDLGINFLGSNDILLKRVTARFKMGWIHTDYSKYNEFKALDALMWKNWGEVDRIVNVSDECTRIFQTCFPSLAQKCLTIENVLSPDLVRLQANDNVSVEMPAIAGEYRICSVGRFSYAKNFDSIPEIVVQLNDLGIKVKWYLIGYGSDESLIRTKILDAGVEEQVIILGKKSNPYPYMQACDIYVQPSRFEGKAVTVREAQILGKPVLIGNFPTARDQLEDGVDGMIAKDGITGLVDGIQTLIEDPELRNRIAATAIRRDYSNRGEVEKIYHLMPA